MIDDVETRRKTNRHWRVIFGENRWSKDGLQSYGNKWMLEVRMNGQSLLPCEVEPC